MIETDLRVDPFPEHPGQQLFPEEVKGHMNLDFLQNLPHEDRTSIRLTVPFTTSGSHSQPPIFRSDRLLKNAHLRRFPYPSPLDVHQSTPRGSGFREPCIRAFLNSLPKRLIQQAVGPEDWTGWSLTQTPCSATKKHSSRKHPEDAGKRPLQLVCRP
jgi:hypothetical protein